ncbi:MAG: thiol oxidoreductase [Bacteroidetes bacterium]|nr:MAG: thiol oxidoreductase [Bacteroidota bacterium]
MKKILLFLSFCIYIMVACQKQSDIFDLIEDKEELSGGQATSFDFSENAFGKSVDGLSGQQEDAFVLGNSFFRNNWVTAPASASGRDGLGIFFNASSCGGCHFKDGRAKTPANPNESLNGLLFRLSISGQNANGSPLPEPNYGGQLNEKAISGVNSEAKIRVNYAEIAGKYPDGTTFSLRKPMYEFYEPAYGDFHANMLVSPRIAQQLAGLGLLEIVPENTILLFADPNDQNNDGISGKANYVWDKVQKKAVLGRFGWKANQPNLFQQSADAFLGDIGITSSLNSEENLTPIQKSSYPNLPNGGSPEISDANLQNVVFYLQALAVPARRNWKDQTVLRGKQLFTQIRCASCHIPEMQTGFSPIKTLANQKIRPYTDLLLHDLGQDLADNRPDFLANGNEWRTPPLWGLGMLKTVNNHTFLLHDGRARNFEEAILWHGGEAEKAKNEFKNLSKVERESLIKFLESL